ncbi:MAG TPA: hypothetical protein DCM32_05660 [Xanthomonadaceae bacterium]|jgi:hypothetical protein|nr:hypothetical protein [Xanthomonadaceae bacterium]
MSKVRVPLWQQPGKFVVLDTTGREPATIGVNVFLPDGSLYRPGTAVAAPVPAGPPAVGGLSVTAWGAVQNVPANVRAVELMTGAGVLTRAGDGALRGKTLAAGANVNIVEDANTITLSSTGGNTATGTGGLWDLGDRIAGLGRFDGGTRV